MPRKWTKTTYPGVRYREHLTRNFNRQKDKYFMIRYKRDGKTVNESLGWLSDGMTTGEAATLRGQIIQNIKKGESPQSVAEMRELKAAAVQVERDQAEAERRDNFTFGEAAGLFLAWADDNKKSAKDDRIRYKKHLEQRFGKIPIRDISPFHLQRLKSALKKKGLAPATVTQCLQLIRAIFNYTKEWEKHDCDFPKTKKLFPEVSNRREAFLMPEQADELLDAVKKKSIQLWCQCVLGLYAGLRFGEIAGLELQDIDFDGGILHVRDAKGGTRKAYITDLIKAMFFEWWAFTDKKPGLLFPARPGKKNKDGGRQVRVSPVFARTVDELKFNDGIDDPRQKIVFHSLRHSFASWLVMGGKSLVVVKELMGHKDIQTTMRYAHLATDVARDAAETCRDLKLKEKKPRLEAVK